MSSKLLIVESPGKIKKLKSFLDNDWEVMASVGHVRDLPFKNYGLCPPDFKPVYEVTEDKKSVVEKLRTAVKKADEVYLASDPDREGEAIAWHLKDLLGLSSYKRVTYTAITKEDVLAGIEAYRDIDMNLVHAQEARRGLDRLVGFKVSAPLSEIVGTFGLSAGRVQSPAVRIIVDREREIRAFVSTTHFGVELSFTPKEGEPWKAQWLPKEGFLEEGEEYVLDKELAERVAAIRALSVLSFEEKEAKTSPPAPFTTSTLQQAASNALKLAPKRTMDLAQKLYEGGHITYMRTDSPNLSESAIKEIREFAEGKGLPLSDKPRTWKSKAGAQEAHEAIRPTHIEVEEVTLDLEGVDKRFVDDAAALYKLIRLRALACQLADALFSVRVVRVQADLDDKKAIFEGRGRTLVSPGWLSVSGKAAEEDEEEEPTNPIPVLENGASIEAGDGRLLTKKTKPKSRFKQASLIKELEKRGIGRPATYAAILDNIMSRQYLKEEKGYLVPTPLGEKLVDALKPSFSFLDLDFTKGMEDALDDIACGKNTFASCMRKFHETLVNELDAFKRENAQACPKCGDKENFRHMYSKKDGYDYWRCKACESSFVNDGGRPGAEKAKPVETEFACEKCGKPLKHIKTEKYDFFACSAPKEECGATYDNVDGKPVAKKPREVTEFNCPKCGKPLTLFEGTSKAGKPYKKFNCTGYPKCKESYWGKDDGTPDFDGANSKGKKK